ncbi:DsbA family protein [Pseudomonas sp. MS19]|uniref:DsbA family protein n=1 Tax=Pseudomonas sp. MS19 TaxID=2579939 RepID=UPI001561D356|nr:DsbA family oxidoreductase [Pseudomonas sp. MS19]
MTAVLQIDAFFDFVCPWCLIGKRQLARALAQLAASRPDVEVVLSWHGVQLLPHLPENGVPFAAFYLQRLGSAEAVRMRQAEVEQSAAAVDLQIDLSRIEKMPNTGLAHRLFERAASLGTVAQRDALLERLFAAYFVRGEDIGERTTLLAIAEQCGFSKATLDEYMAGSSQPMEANNRGSSGVPHFVFNHQYLVSGAQSASVLLQAMHEALDHVSVGGQQA